MLQPITEELWGAEHDLFLSPAQLHFRGRMTVVRLGDGRLLLHSPIPIDNDLAAALAGLGTVAHLVAPNCFHHLHLAAAAARYPRARVYAAPGLAEKRRELKIDETLADEAPAAWRDELEQLLIAGMPKVNEIVFFHRRSSTLIVSDLCFNVQTCQGWLTPWVLRLSGVYRRLAVSRLFRSLVRDRAAVAARVERLLQLEPRRLVMAHGEIVEGPALADVLAPLRGAST